MIMVDCEKCRFVSVCKKRPKMPGAKIAECNTFRERLNKENPTTNADRIRAMSDEELAEWLLEVMKHKVACFGEGAFEYTPCRNVEHDCVKCGVEWLKQPVGDE